MTDRQMKDTTFPETLEIPGPILITRDTNHP